MRDRRARGLNSEHRKMAIVEDLAIFLADFDLAFDRSMIASENSTPASVEQLFRLPGENTFTSRILSPTMSIPTRNIPSAMSLGRMISATRSSVLRFQPLRPCRRVNVGANVALGRDAAQRGIFAVNL